MSLLWRNRLSLSFPLFRISRRWVPPQNMDCHLQRIADLCLSVHTLFGWWSGDCPARVEDSQDACRSLCLLSHSRASLTQRYSMYYRAVEFLSTQRFRRFLRRHFRAGKCSYQALNAQPKRLSFHCRPTPPYCGRSLFWNKQLVCLLVDNFFVSTF